MGLRTLMNTTMSTNTNMSISMRTHIPKQAILNSTNTSTRESMARTAIRTSRRNWSHTATPTKPQAETVASSHHDR